MPKKEKTVIELMTNLGKLTMVNKTRGYYDISNCILTEPDIVLLKKHIALDSWQIDKVGDVVRFYIDLDVEK